MEDVRFAVLGPMRVDVGGHEAAITAVRDRTLLAALALSVSEPVPMSRLIDAIWGGEPPRKARSQVQGCVSRLRRLLADAGGSEQLIVTEPSGYRLAVDASAIDISEFRRLRDDARAAAALGDHAGAARHYRAALALWRAPALVDIDSELIRRTAAPLDEERLQAVEECVDSELAQGRSAELVPELTELVREHPYRERLHGALMLALYRAGRQADALAEYRSARQLLLDELGAEPGPALQGLHRAILNRDPRLDPSRPEPPSATGAVPRELPLPAVGFVGRTAALKALDDCMAEGTAGANASVMIAAIVGTAGVGKTALAVHWAHRVADRFPDGQLYVNLRGFANGPPVRPIDALAAMLRSLGVPPEQIPTDEGQAAGLYRTRLTGRRILIVLDDAESAGQVRRLLPGSAGCLVLITSRNRLSGLVARDGARRITLDVLSLDEARELLACLLGPQRVDAEPGPIATLSRACAYLPLALRIAAASLGDSPAKPVATYVAELTTGDRLTHLQADDDLESAVEAAFELSYRGIPAEAQGMFRLLGLAPGPDFSASAAAALAGVKLADAHRLLDRLASTHLIEESAPGRYAFHDLLRAYALHRTHVEQTGDECREATDRLVSWYLATADHAAETLHPETLVRLPIPAPKPRTPRTEFAGPAEALAWLETEQVTLKAVVHQATERGPRPPAWLLAERLRGYFWRRRYAADWEVVGNDALTAARLESDVRAQATAHLGLADLEVTRSNYAAAMEHYTIALDLAQRAGWLPAQAAILGNLGIMRWSQGRLRGAATCYSQALAIHEQAGNKAGQAACYTNLGLVFRGLGRLREAIDCHLQALDIFSVLHSRRVGNAHINLGHAYHDLGRLDLALRHLSSALAMHDEVGDRSARADALPVLAAVHRDAGQLGVARDFAEAALDLAAEIGGRRQEIEALNACGTVYLQLNQPAPALRHHQRALDLSRESGSSLSKTVALLGLAAVTTRLGHTDAAARYAEQALRLAREAQYRVLEGQALTALAEVMLVQGRHAAAKDRASSALAIHREAGHRLGEASALAVLGRSLLADDPGTAREMQRAAETILAELRACLPDDTAG